MADFAQLAQNLDWGVGANSAAAPSPLPLSSVAHFRALAACTHTHGVGGSNNDDTVKCFTRVFVSGNSGCCCCVFFFFGFGGG